MSDVAFHGDGEGGGDRNDMDHLNKDKLEKLKSFREKVNWEIENERHDFLFRLRFLIEDWKGQLPDLRDICKDEEIERLLFDSINITSRSWSYNIEDRFVWLVSRTGYKDKSKLVSHCTTPVHLAARHSLWSTTDELFKIYDKFDVNCTDEVGLTHFHVACMSGNYDVVVKFLELGQDPNCLPRKSNASSVDPPLIMAVYRYRYAVVRLLLRNGADPNLANAEGQTPLHFMIKACFNEDLVKMLFHVRSYKYQPVQINARDKDGNTPLHLAVYRSNTSLVKFLLKNGANPKLSNAEGKTPLHNICHRYYDDSSMKIFFMIIDAKYQPLQVDVQDKGGRTPLHYALSDKYKYQIVNELLTLGADPNLTDAKGLTSLHIICQGFFDNDLVKIFFNIIDDKQLTVQVDAKDNLGRTPLQLAVAGLLPRTVNDLLDRGADLSCFVFLAEHFFADRDEKLEQDNTELILKLMPASRALSVVERLEERGYKLKRKDALLIMKFLARLRFFDKSAVIEKCRYNDEEFVSETKAIMISSSLSLYDLISLQPEEAAKILTYEDYNKFQTCPTGPGQVCFVYLREILSRKFCRRWALDSFLELTRRYRLPILCCNMIIENLKNEDLYRIFLAAA